MKQRGRVPELTELSVTLTLRPAPQVTCLKNEGEPQREDPSLSRTTTDMCTHIHLYLHKHELLCMDTHTHTCTYPCMCVCVCTLRTSVSILGKSKLGTSYCFSTHERNNETRGLGDKGSISANNHIINV